MVFILWTGQITVGTDPFISRNRAATSSISHMGVEVAPQMPTVEASLNQSS